MAKKIVTILIAAAATATMLFTGGCGGDNEATQNQAPDDALHAAASGSGDDFNARLDELKKTPISVEIVQNGSSEGKWSQDGQGSWRYQTSDNSDEYFIFNAEQNKFWSVSGNTALESSGAESGLAYEGSSPVLLMSAFTALTYAPRTGGTDDVWEWEIPGSGKLSIEFRGPQGLVSKVTSEDPTTNEADVTEFIYSDVGDVPASTFELPSGVTVQSSDTFGTGTGTDTSGYGDSIDTLTNGSYHGSGSDGGLYDDGSTQ